MSTITLHGNTIQVSGNLPQAGSKAPDFSLISKDLKNVSLKDFPGKKLLSVYPSIDTSTCNSVARYFNKESEKLSDLTILNISRDLPFAASRFCTDQEITSMEFLSDTRRDVPSFGGLYGLEIADGPLAGLLARAVIVLDAQGTVVYTGLVAEITEEPDYTELLKHL